MIAFARQDAGGDPIIGAHRQGPASDLHFVAGGQIGLLRIIRGEYAVRLMKRAVGIPVPPSPADVDQQDYLEQGMAPHVLLWRKIPRCSVTSVGTQSLADEMRRRARARCTRPGEWLVLTLTRASVPRPCTSRLPVRSCLRRCCSLRWHRSPFLGIPRRCCISAWV